MLFLLFSFSAFPQKMIYQKTDTNGEMNFSDTPTTGATSFKLKPANIYSSTPSPSVDTKNKNEMEKNTYQTFSLIEPSDKQTFQNQQEISAVVRIDPALQSGDNVAWWLDGKLYRQAASTQVTISALERGEHKLQAKLLNPKNHILMTTQTITFYVHSSVADSFAIQ